MRRPSAADLRLFPHWYGAGPLHLLTLIGSFALAGYAAAGLLPHHVIGIAFWFVGAVIGHDLILMPLYTIADRSAQAVFRHRPSKLPAVPWINYLRVPAALSGLLLLIWFPLILRLPDRFPFTTTLSLDPYLWHWLAVTGVLFLLSATALALRQRAAGRGVRKRRAAGIAPVGTVLPDAQVLDVRGAATTLYAAAGAGPSVLVFCRDGTITLPAYQAQLLPQLTERGVRLVAVSSQQPDGLLTMQQKYGLTFTAVSDPGNAVAGGLGLDPAGAGADGKAAPPMPATVILDASRAVQWIDVHPDHGTHTKPQQVIDALDSLKR
ncbi:MAG TPA: redoxin domain-containing protein [Trebonia sp.]